jgi:hypothetical protein
MAGSRQGDKPMGDTTTTLPPRASSAWMAYQVAFTKLLAELGGEESAKAGAQAASSQADIKKTVTEAVSAVLLETKVLERIIDRQIKAHLDGGSAPKGAEGGLEVFRQEVPKIVREYLQRHLAALFESEVRGVIHKEIMTFMASDELKELMDDKFRLMNTYLKTDVIPKVVQQELARAET